MFLVQKPNFAKSSSHTNEAQELSIEAWVITSSFHHVGLCCLNPL